MRRNNLWIAFHLSITTKLRKNAYSYMSVFVFYFKDAKIATDVACDAKNK